MDIKAQTIVIKETWFQDIAEGQLSALEALYGASSTVVYAYALSLLRHKADAEDAVQETFLKIRRAAHLYQAKEKPLAWILTKTRNICYMKLRGQQLMASQNAEDFQKQQCFSEINDPHIRLMLEAAFQVLSEEEREIVILHAVTGYKHREISRLLQKPLMTVISKYNRGIKKLRKVLEEDE